MGEFMKKALIILLFSLAPVWAQDEFTLSIIHVNDTHAKHEASIKKDKTTGVVTTNGGAAQLSGVIAQELALNSNALVLHAGDTMTGSAYTLIYKGIDSSQLMNMTGFSIATLGNHEFDFGLKGAYAVLKARKFPTVSANVVEADTGKLVVPPYVITNIGSKKIAVIGLIINDEVFTQRLGSKGFIKVNDGIDTLIKLFAEDNILKSADYFILLSHSGAEVDKKIAAAFPNKFSVIVGGHSHTLLKEPFKVGNTFILQVDNNLKRVGRLDLTFKDNKVSGSYKQIPLINTTSDPAVEKYVAAKKKGIDSKMGQKIGFLSGTDLEDTAIRTKSTPLGNFISDLLLDIYKDTGIDFILLNSGTVRTSLHQGDITLQTMFELHPFDSTAYVVSLKGSIIEEILELSAGKNWDEGGFLQVSKGLIIQTDKNRKIQNISLNGKPIEPEKDYTVLVNDWLYGGGDGYTMIPAKAAQVRYLGSDFRDMMIEKIKQEKVFDSNQVDSSERWIFGK